MKYGLINPINFQLFIILGSQMNYNPLILVICMFSHLKENVSLRKNNNKIIKIINELIIPS